MKACPTSEVKDQPVHLFVMTEGISPSFVESLGSIEASWTVKAVIRLGLRADLSLHRQYVVMQMDAADIKSQGSCQIFKFRQ